MVEHVLPRFLQAGLVDVGGDDGKLEKLQQTAADLAAVLRKKPSKAVSFCLVAFDPHVADDDPVVGEVLQALEKRWVTFANVFSGTPLTVVRAMLLEALVESATADERIGVAFVALARNVLPGIDMAADQAIWADVVAEIERHVDLRAEKEWAAPSSITVPALQVEQPVPASLTVTGEPVDRDHLRQLYWQAAGPQAQDRQQAATATSGNPHWPQTNAPWVGEFGRRMADATADALEQLIDGAVVDQTHLTGPLTDLAASISAYVEEALKTVSNATAGLQRRTNLLWWKEARHSPSAGRSYRGLPPEAVMPLMAFDLHQQVPLFSPASVMAFLFETVLALPGIDLANGRRVGDLVAAARQHHELAVFRETAAILVPAPSGRGPLLSLICHPEAHASHAEEEFHRLTGLAPETELTLADWSLWIFRELQAVRAVAESGTPKRRSRQR